MKTISFILFLTAFTINCFGYGGGHDSLLFDGSNIYSDSYFKMSDECNVKVTTVIGKVYGNKVTVRIENTCGNDYDTIPSLIYGEVRAGDILASESYIRTGEYSQVELELKSGKKIRLGQKTEFLVGKDYCKGDGVAQLMSGKVHVKGEKGEKITYVSTERSMVQITNTEFSLEISTNGSVITDILRMYEGTVFFGNNMGNIENQNKVENASEQMQKAGDDFKNGKISMDEYVKKLEELSEGSLQGESSVTVNAGYESTITGTGNLPSAPVPFNTEENRWWEEK